MKGFVEALDKEGEEFTFLHEKFPQKSKAIITAGVFNSPQIRDRFESALNSVEL